MQFTQNKAVRQMLQIADTLFVAGHHPSQLGPLKVGSRDALLEKHKPDILVVDKPQDLWPYAQRAVEGESLATITRDIVEETFMNPVLFRNDCVPLMLKCKSLGINEIHFVEIPSYIGNVAPLYLDNKYGGQTTREKIMSLRLKEIQLKRPAATKILMLVEDMLVLHVYQRTKRLKDHDLEKIQADKMTLSDRLIDLLLSEMSHDPIIMGSAIYEQMKHRATDNFDQLEAEYRTVLQGIIESEAPCDAAIKEASQLSDLLCELRFGMFKFVTDPEDSETIMRLKKAKQQLDVNLISGALRNDFLAEIS